MKTYWSPWKRRDQLDYKTFCDFLTFDDKFVLVVEISDQMDVSFSGLEKLCECSQTRESAFQKCLIFTIKESQGRHSNLKGLLRSIQIRIYILSLLFKELSRENTSPLARIADAFGRNDCHLNICISFYPFRFKSNLGRLPAFFHYEEYVSHRSGT